MDQGEQGSAEQSPADDEVLPSPERRQFLGAARATLGVTAFGGLAACAVQSNMVYAATCGNTTASTRHKLPTNVRTTIDETVVPVPVAAGAPKLLPNEVAKFAPNGYGVWKKGAGLAVEKRWDLLPKAYPSAAGKVTRVARLVRFFSMTDIHITDFQSPAQTINFGMAAQPGMSSAYSPVIPYTTHVLDAAIQTVNALHKKDSFDFGLFLGDAINNCQHNELRWYVDLIDGGEINPNSDTKSKASTSFARPYNAAGLDKSIPWYQVLGNHDHFWSGVEIPNDYIKEAMVGASVLNVGDVVRTNDLNSRGFYMGVVDASSEDAVVVNYGAVSHYPSPPKVTANPHRFCLSRNQWMAEFFNTHSSPVGHGFSQENVRTGFACYSFEPKKNLPLKVIVLDDTNGDNSKQGNGALGALDPERFNWLVRELDKGQAEGKLMIVAAHVPVGVSVPQFSMWDSASSPAENDLIAKLHTYPNLILWVAGHRHYNTVTPLPSPDPSRPELGFWGVETASLRDFPQQFRCFDLVLNDDKTLSILAINVDPAVAPGSPAAKSRSYGIATASIFNSWPTNPPTGAYNSELVVTLTPEMQAKLRLPGPAISS